MQLFFALLILCSSSLTLAEDQNTTVDSDSEMMQGILLGGLQDASSDLDLIDTLTSYINDHRYNQTGMDENIWLISNVSNVTSQLVSGMIYRLDVTLSRTECLKKDVDVTQLRSSVGDQLCSMENDGDTDESENVVIHYKILVKPWLGSTEILAEDLYQVVNENSTMSTKTDTATVETTTTSVKA